MFPISFLNSSVSFLLDLNRLPLEEQPKVSAIAIIILITVNSFFDVSLDLAVFVGRQLSANDGEWELGRVKEDFCGGILLREYHCSESF
jgi:hypothetical protein